MTPTRRRILLVDDEPDILLSIKLLLERPPHAYQVLTASSGAQGLEILHGTTVDLIVSDFKMPGMDGIAFLAAARAVQPGVPTIMFTAYADEELAQRAREQASVDEFLSKTLASKDMLAKVKALLA